MIIKYENLFMMILSILPIIFFHHMNKDNRIMIYMHFHNRVKYFTIKAMVAILMLIFVMNMKDLIFY
jgi:hypothetical protein